jgi:hypothetical protein
MPAPYYEPPPTDVNGELYRRVAAGHVQRLAPVPTPEPTDYAEAAEAAEFMVYDYLKNTGGGQRTSQSRSGLSVTFADFDAIKNLVAPVMGDYYTGSRGAFRTVDIERA